MHVIMGLFYKPVAHSMDPSRYIPKVTPKAVVGTAHGDFTSLDGTTQALSLLFKIMDCPHLRSAITSYLLSHEISRFKAAFMLLEWRNDEKKICTDLLHNMFNNEKAALKAIEADMIIVLMGKDLSAIMSRWKQPFSNIRPSTSFKVHVALVDVIQWEDQTMSLKADGINYIACARETRSDWMKQSVDPTIELIPMTGMRELPKVLQTPARDGSHRLVAYANDFVSMPSESHTIDAYIINKEGIFNETVRLSKGLREPTCCSSLRHATLPVSVKTKTFFARQTMSGTVSIYNPLEGLD